MKLALSIAIASFLFWGPDLEARNRSCQSLFDQDYEEEDLPDILRTAEQSFLKNLRSTLYFSEEDLNFWIPATVRKAAYGKPLDFFKEALENSPEFTLSLRKKLITEYRRQVKESQVTLDQEQLSALFGDVPWYQVEPLFSSIKALEDEALNISYLRSVIRRDHFDETYREKLRKKIEQHKTVFVAGVVSGERIPPDRLKALEKMVEDRNAILVVKAVGADFSDLDPVLFEKDWIYLAIGGIDFDPELRLSKVKVAKTIKNPLNQAKDDGQLHQSLIVASPKVQSRSVPHINNEAHTKFEYSTGSITTPKDWPIQKSTLINRNLPSLLVLERKENAVHSHFHVRRIRYDFGAWKDLGNIWYTPKGKKVQKRVEALIPGDLHLGDLDLEAWNKVLGLIERLQPKNIVLHDTFNGHSVNRHIRLNKIEQAKLAAQGKRSIAAEIDLQVTFFNELLQKFPDLNIYIDVANHNQWLDSYIAEGLYLDDQLNFAVGTALANALVNEDEESALAFAVMYGAERYPNLFEESLIDPGRVHFLRKGEIQMFGKKRQVLTSLHGHVGARGARGSSKSYERFAESVIIGHHHHVLEQDQLLTVGTLTYKNLSYTKDSVSDWAQSVGVIDQDGSIQNIVLSDGEFFNRTIHGDVQRVRATKLPEGFPTIDGWPWLEE